MDKNQSNKFKLKNMLFDSKQINNNRPNLSDPLLLKKIELKNIDKKLMENKCSNYKILFDCLKNNIFLFIKNNYLNIIILIIIACFLLYRYRLMKKINNENNKLNKLSKKKQLILNTLIDILEKNANNIDIDIDIDKIMDEQIKLLNNKQNNTFFGLDRFTRSTINEINDDQEKMINNIIKTNKVVNKKINKEINKNDREINKNDREINKEINRDDKEINKDEEKIDKNEKNIDDDKIDDNKIDDNKIDDNKNNDNKNDYKKISKKKEFYQNYKLIDNIKSNINEPFAFDPFSDNYMLI